MVVGGTVDVCEIVGGGIVDGDVLVVGWTDDGCEMVGDWTVDGFGTVGATVSWDVAGGTVGGPDVQKVIFIWKRQTWYYLTMVVGGADDVGETVGCGTVDTDGIVGGWTVDGCESGGDWVIGG